VAWLLRRSPNILPIPGTSKVAHLRENITGAGLTLSAQDVAELDTIGGAEVQPLRVRLPRLLRPRGEQVCRLS
jgi:pyridoxine 4-dehydrogenase